MYSSLILRERISIIRRPPCNLSFTRSARRGPRSYPGGLKKWQWLALIQKRARDKERALMNREKHLYEARYLAHIRCIVGKQAEFLRSADNTIIYRPVRDKDEVKALADRFKADGAEDLWNEEDGHFEPPPPCSSSSIESTVPYKAVPSIIDFSKMILPHRSLTSSFEKEDSVNPNYCLRPRHFSARVPSRKKRPMPRKKYRRNESSDFDSEDDFEESPEAENVITEQPLTREELLRRELALPDKSNVKKLLTRVPFGKDHFKTTKRVSLKDLDKECNYLWQPERIREELKKRMMEKEMTKVTEEKEDKEKAKDGLLLSGKRFDECNISPQTTKALTSAGYVQMTMSQEATFSAFLEGKDALVKAKTDRDNFASFLVPAIESVLKASHRRTTQRVPPIYVVILCPTAERASQIVAEANIMLKYHAGLGVQSLVGGTRLKLDLGRLDANPCQIMVANPGRLLDHIENKSGFSVRINGLRMLVIDDIDHLLNLGFRKDVLKIVEHFPRHRQSLMFSASVPREVHRISQLVFKTEHVYIDPAATGPGWAEIHDKVKHRYLIAPHEEHFHIVHHLLKEHISRVPDHKAIVFCTTAMVASLMFRVFRGMNMNVREMHSGMPHLICRRVSDEFRDSTGMLLITCDDTTCGKIYPDASLVIQVGIPPSRGQYIHRAGRAKLREGDEDEDGEGTLLLSPWEEHFIDKIKDLLLTRIPSPKLDEAAKIKMGRLMGRINYGVKEAAYRSCLEYYHSIREFGRNKRTHVMLASQLSTSLGLTN